MLRRLRVRLVIFFPAIRDSLFHEKPLHTHNVEDRPESVLCIKEICFAVCLTSYPDFVKAFPKMCKAVVSICLELPFFGSCKSVKNCPLLRCHFIAQV